MSDKQSKFNRYLIDSSKRRKNIELKTLSQWLDTFYS